MKLASPPSPNARALLTIAIMVVLSGCATVRPQHWQESFRAAATSPDTWVPAAAAVVAGATADAEISDWAREETPLFGSNANAEAWSNHLKGGTQLLVIGTALSIDVDWRTRALRLLEQELVTRGVSEITGFAKGAADRERPNASDRSSFPSGHASVSAARRSLTESNLTRSRLPPRWRIVAARTARAAAIGTAWARVEAGQHYPSDVLAGAALGNLVARFVDELFDRRAPFRVSVEVSRDGVAILLRSEPRPTVARDVGIE